MLYLLIEFFVLPQLFAAGFPITIVQKRRDKVNMILKDFFITRRF